MTLGGGEGVKIGQAFGSDKDNFELCSSLDQAKSLGSSDIEVNKKGL